MDQAREADDCLKLGLGFCIVMALDSGDGLELRAGYSLGLRGQGWLRVKEIGLTLLVMGHA